MKTSTTPPRHLPVQQGFTLIELLIVMSIIGILATLVGPKLFDKVGSSKVKAAQAQISMLESALDSYRLDIGLYPPTLEGLRSNIDQHPLWSGPYIRKAVPKDPWGESYHYQLPGTHNNDLNLYSLGADGNNGGTGENQDIANW